MANALAAYLYLTTTGRADVDVAQVAGRPWRARRWAPASGPTTTPSAAWAGGDWHGAARILDDLLERWPADVLAVLRRPRARLLPGRRRQPARPARPRRSAPSTPPTRTPRFVRGMQAFGLEESGHYEAAEDAGLAAVAVNPDDVWAIHAVTHTYEMRGRVATGVEFLTRRERGLGERQPVHGAQLVAPGPVPARAGRPGGRAGHLRPGGPPRGLRGHAAQPGRRVRHAVAAVPRPGRRRRPLRAPLADAWAGVDDARPWYAFNDVHATMAYVGAGRMGEAEAVVERLSEYVNGDTAAPGPTWP